MYDLCQDETVAPLLNKKPSVVAAEYSWDQIKAALNKMDYTRHNIVEQLIQTINCFGDTINEGLQGLDQQNLNQN